MADSKLDKSIKFYTGTQGEYELTKDNSALDAAFVDILSPEGDEQGIVMLNGVPIGFKHGLQGILGTQGQIGTQGVIG